MDNANRSASAAAPRRRRWDDTPAPAQSVPAPHALPPAPPLPTAAAAAAAAPAPHAAPINVQEAKRLAALKAAELAAKSLSSSSSASSALPDRPSSLITTASGFTQDIDINDCRNRYLLTKADTQRGIKADTGCEITTRGQYLPDRAQATAARPPLHLHVSATTRDALDSAVAKIKEMMDRPVDPLLSERASFAPRRHDPRDEDRGDEGGAGRGGLDRRPPPLSEKVFIDFAVNDRRFNVRAKVVGPKGSYVKHIQTTTGVRIQLKGQGSGYTETATGRESDEDLHVHLWTTQPSGEVAMKKAKDLLEDLLASVRVEYERWSEGNGRSRDMMGGPGHGGMGGGPGGPGANVDSYRPGGGGPDMGGDRDRDRPHMDMHYAPSHASSSEYAGGNPAAGADPYAAYPTAASSGFVPAAPAAPVAPQFVHQPPYAAPEPPRHIVKTADDRDKYTEYYAQFYCYYFQLASEGKSMPVVEVPEAPAGGEADAQDEAPVAEQQANEQAVAAVVPAVGADGQPPAGQEDMDPAAAAQWQQYYAQYYASMGYSADGSAPGAATADASATASAAASVASVPGSEGAADASAGGDADHAAQWAAYYAYYGQPGAAAAGAPGGEEGVEAQQQQS